MWSRQLWALAGAELRHGDGRSCAGLHQCEVANAVRMTACRFCGLASTNWPNMEWGEVKKTIWATFLSVGKFPFISIFKLSCPGNVLWTLVCALSSAVHQDSLVAGSFCGRAAVTSAPWHGCCTLFSRCAAARAQFGRWGAFFALLL